MDSVHEIRCLFMAINSYPNKLTNQLNLFGNLKRKKKKNSDERRERKIIHNNCNLTLWIHVY